MDIVYHRRQGSQAEEPAAVDTTSSKTTVYVRKNIEQIEVEQDGETIKLWQYDEAELTPEEYWKFSVDENQMDMVGKIEYIAMMTDVELEV